MFVFSCSGDADSKDNNGQVPNNVVNNNGNIPNGSPCDGGDCLFNALKIDGFNGRFLQFQDKLYAVSLGDGIILSTLEGDIWVSEKIAETSGFVEVLAVGVNGDGEVAVAWSSSDVKLVTKVDDEWVVEVLLDFGVRSLALEYTNEIVVAYSSGSGPGLLTKDNGEWVENTVPETADINTNVALRFFDNKYYLASHDPFVSRTFDLSIWDGQSWSTKNLLSEVSSREASENVSLTIEGEKLYASLGANEGFKIGDVSDGTWTEANFPQLEGVVGNHTLLFKEGIPNIAYIGNQPSYAVLKGSGWASQQIYSTDSDDGAIDAAIDPVSKEVFILLNAQDGLRSMTPIGVYPGDHFSNCDTLTEQLCSNAKSCGENEGDICVFPRPENSNCFSNFGCASNVRSSFCGDAATPAESVVACMEGLDSGMCIQQQDGDLGFFLPPECGMIYQ